MSLKKRTQKNCISGPNPEGMPCTSCNEGKLSSCSDHVKLTNGDREEQSRSQQSVLLVADQSIIIKHSEFELP